MTEDTTQDVQATPAAQATAEEAGVDLTQVEGTGADGKITKADVVAAATAPEPTGPVTHVTDDPNFTVDVHVFQSADGRWNVAIDPHLNTGDAVDPALAFGTTPPTHELAVSVGGRAVWLGNV